MSLAHRCLLLILLLGLAGCASGPAYKPASRGESTPAVVNYALSLQGAPYRPGKDSPQEGFDCSGFIAHVYREYGIVLPRTVREMAYALPEVEPARRRPGDLVFFDTEGRAFNHVGLYVGEDRFIHAPSSRTGRVMVSSLAQPYWGQRFSGVRRPPVGQRPSLSSLR
ncbi:C40 family peptidase [Methylococcus sp. EFPC2]|uniref:C40 family peptidase n=1 Tax=Methylococcus sp. EFPC2 TaxID=2812648 RepID=UPI00196707A6|nr:C40 family peptidase [Methylococcus sp. EFPC2]QSA96973.1 C40 family peptidase [Methylococcus sp. EFPC2]